MRSSKKGRIVPEVLDKENYVDWSVRVHTYLLAEDLWDIVESNDEPPKPADHGNVDENSDRVGAEYRAWRKKNAAALHAIQICCGPDAFSVIRDITSAKIAWETLASKFKPQLLRAKTMVSSESSRSEVTISSDDFNLNEPFYNAVWSGDWQATNEFIARNPDVVRARITYSGRTALHVAAINGDMSIVETLVDKMSEEDLEIKDINGFTALAIAATYNASIKIAECMVRKNTKILIIHVIDMLPAALAFRYGHMKMGRYLYTVTPLDKLVLPQNGIDGATLICNAIYMQSFDVAWELLKHCPRLAVTPDRFGIPPIYALANLPSAFLSGCRLRFWQKWIYDCIYIDPARAINDICIELNNIRLLTYNMSIIRSPEKDSHHKFWSFRGLALKSLKMLGIKFLYDMKLVHVQTFQLLHQMCAMTRSLDEIQMEACFVYGALFRAVDRGNVEFIISLLTANQELVETCDELGRNIFMRAILYRQANVFNLIHRLDSKLAAATAVDRHGNNMLHMAGMLAPYPQLNQISGAALQMQRELQWFKEVESIVPPWTIEHTNSSILTPAQMFTRDHKNLRTEGEKWMKGTATSCTVVGTLIVTIMFAAAFTVPGGNNQDTGVPIFLNKELFMVFIISDAISLFSSTTSVLMFLGILTSRYAEEDFLKSLPKKMMIGLSTLFFSIVTMMIAFCATILIVLRDRYSWIFIPIISLASIPVTLFVMMQFPLLVEIFVSTYGAGIFDRNVQIWN
ncbi:uncharacterized protein LOC107404058 [Ziziphus jujuba]|uniref:Uncharacterized protein LOC107404058 n=1 Tax=Ziziphus jujuba TaxID=326968 RepID=A0ABM4AAJ2_ZIZJJ|nr:uncharacterized protein LOC107404058 [Ziziphus jujuba]XP_060673751.1 uncharacterized protein LOC107404058 [Ziziphus jujuba]